MERQSRFLAPLTALALVLVLSGETRAQQRGVYEDWAVHVADVNGDRVCYALTDAVDRSPRTIDHGRVVFMIASWSSGAAREQPSFLAGYPLRLGGPTRARIGASQFRMFVDGQEGFIEEGDDERRLVRLMRRSIVMRVEAVAENGTATAYEFSLKGVTRALREVSEACG